MKTIGLTILESVMIKKLKILKPHLCSAWGIGIITLVEKIVRGEALLSLG